jgi:hypothetical protein
MRPMNNLSAVDVRADRRRFDFRAGEANEKYQLAVRIKPKLVSLGNLSHSTRQHITAVSPACENSAIEKAIESSRSILDLQSDWDDAGARPIDIGAWARATQLLRDIALNVGAALPAPHISPCADGSVDLYWNAQDFTLLINVKPDGAIAPSDYYGEKHDGTAPIKGSVSGDFGIVVRRLIGE